jgi:hypothetical protein
MGIEVFKHYRIVIFEQYLPASNEHIPKIAALPRVDNFCVFLSPLLALIKCWEAATSAICHHVSGNARATVQADRVEKKKMKSDKIQKNVVSLQLI